MNREFQMEVRNRPRYPVERPRRMPEQAQKPPVFVNPFGTAFSAEAAARRDFDKSAQK